MAKNEILYRKLAKYYDLVYYNKNYKSEAERIISLIKKYKKSGGNELLEIASGTGKHLQYLKSKFNCVGSDLNSDMINIAKKRVPGVDFKIINMINFNIHKQFDVILCLFSSIGYVKTYENLKKALKNFAHHLKEGGVVIIEPWLTKKSYIKGKVNLNTYEDANTKIARVSFSRVTGDVSYMDMYYLIAEKDKGVNYFKETHEMGLFEVDKVLKIMKSVGFKAVYLKNGTRLNRGLYLGVKDK
jgi:ubiquinone/menaquinone biosynthesis C-methylase UbiE